MGRNGVVKNNPIIKRTSPSSLHFAKNTSHQFIFAVRFWCVPNSNSNLNLEIEQLVWKRGRLSVKLIKMFPWLAKMQIEPTNLPFRCIPRKNLYFGEVRVVLNNFCFVSRFGQFHVSAALRVIVKKKITYRQTWTWL